MVGGGCFCVDKRLYLIKEGRRLGTHTIIATPQLEGQQYLVWTQAVAPPRLTPSVWTGRGAYFVSYQSYSLKVFAHWFLLVFLQSH